MNHNSGDLAVWQKIIIAVTVIVFAAGVIYFSYNTLRAENGKLSRSHEFNFEWVTTQEQRQKGLSGRDNLNKNQAMVFKNDDDSSVCMWMKDMKFPLAMLWLDKDNTILHIEPSVSPDTYPRTYCHRAAFVVEMNPSDLVNSGLAVGQKLQL